MFGYRTFIQCLRVAALPTMELNTVPPSVAQGIINGNKYFLPHKEITPGADPGDFYLCFSCL